jgi:hypothetical protein
MVLSKITGLKRMDVTGYRRKIHNEGFHNLYWTSKYRSGDVTKENRNTYKDLVGET